MKVLHTSDWHLGRTLYGKSRAPEFEAFLGWLLSTLEVEGAGALIVAGDVFDTTTPSHRAQELYYRFLRRVSDAGCRHVVVVGGNHDSPTFLDAPKELLRFLDIHVVGALPEKIAEELLFLRAPDGSPELLVCAVPYLRDRDLRVFEAGEGIGEKERKMLAGMERHYRELGRLAEEKRAPFPDIPVVATGHLFATGGRTDGEDGVRDLYIGSLAHFDAGCLPECFDYVALGHLHTPQRAGGTARYSGSPLPMHPGEAGREKSVALVDFEGRTPRVRTLAVPVFQKMERIAGDMETIELRLGELRMQGGSVWAEIVYEGKSLVPNLRERVAAQTAGSGVEILCVKDSRVVEDTLGRWKAGEMLDELDETDVFSRCLEKRSVPDADRPELLAAYREILASIREDDPEA